MPGSPKAAYASAIAIDFDGQRQYVQLTQKALVGVEASDGKFLWRYDRAANGHGINCSTPIYHDGLVFAASAYGAGGGLVKLSQDANVGVKAEEVYFSKKMQNHHGGMILFDGCLYGANGGNEGGFLVCLDFKTGNVLWDERDDAERRAPKGSVALADGRLYYRTEKGTMLLIEPNPKQYVERGRFDQPDRSQQPAWPHPVIANGKLYLRDQDLLFCYDVKAGGNKIIFVSIPDSLLHGYGLGSAAGRHPGMECSDARLVRARFVSALNPPAPRQAGPLPQWL